MYAPEQTARNLREIAKSFLDAFQLAQYDKVWNELITTEAANLLSVATFPLYAVKYQKVNNLLAATGISGLKGTADQVLSLAFGLDVEGIRSGLFSGIASGFHDMGWYDFKEDGSYVFLQGNNAVLLAETPHVPMILPFIFTTDGSYKVDFEALLLFSMQISAKLLYGVGLRAVEQGQSGAALTYFEVTSSLVGAHTRLRNVVWEHPVARVLVTEERQAELREDFSYVVLARDQVLKLLSQPRTVNKVTNTAKFLSSLFRNYDQIPITTISEDDITRLNALGDSELRKGIASILVGVDSVVAQREAEKPHSGAEISDMEVPIDIDGEPHFLCMPFKTGKEIRKSTVPVDVAYQIIRPFMLMPKCVVVFITAKPCSQYLHNYIKQARATQGWIIEVIEHKELAKLLKANGYLIS